MKLHLSLYLYTSRRTASNVNGHKNNNRLITTKQRHHIGEGWEGRRNTRTSERNGPREKWINSSANGCQGREMSDIQSDVEMRPVATAAVYFIISHWERHCSVFHRYNRQHNSIYHVHAVSVCKQIQFSLNGATTKKQQQQPRNKKRREEEMLWLMMKLIILMIFDDPYA